MSIWNDIEKCLADLDEVNAVALKFGRDMVLAEAKYYSVKAEEAFSLKKDGYAVTFIEMVIKGVPKVSNALTEYHMSQIEYENARDCVNVLKKKLTALCDQYQREWSQSGLRG